MKETELNNFIDFILREYKKVISERDKYKKLYLGVNS
jgi:hypothetical protein